MSSNFGSRIIWGGFFILLGLSFLGDNILPFNLRGVIWTWWPAIIALFGVWILIAYPRNFVVGLIFLAGGAFLLLNKLGVTNISIWNLWPLFLVGVGLNMILNRKEQPAGSKDIETITEVAVFGGAKKNIVSKNFKSANLTAICGGLELDLSKVELTQDAKIDITAVMGGVQLKVPAGVEVINNILPIMGGIEDKHETAKEGSKHKIILTGFAFWGGVEIK